MRQWNAIKLNWNSSIAIQLFGISFMEETLCTWRQILRIVPEEQLLDPYCYNNIYINNLPTTVHCIRVTLSSTQM